MRVLVTGATGYIGGQLVLRLIEEGHEVSVIIRSKSVPKLPSWMQDSVDVCLYEESYLSVLRAIDSVKPELVIHLASLFLSQHASHDVERLIKSNIIFPTFILEAMDEVGVGMIINTGTSWQHFLNAHYSPVNLYAATKQSFEDLLTYYVEAKNFKAITLKLFDTYGPGDQRSKLFSLLRRAARDGTILRMSPGEQKISLVYISDVVEAFYRSILMLPEVSGLKSFAVGNTCNISIQELVALYSNIVGRSIRVEWGGVPYRSREVLEPWAAKNFLPGWCARIELMDGIVCMEKDPSIGGLLVSV